MPRLRLSETAEFDLIDIWDYVARDNPRAADRYIDAVYAHCRELAESPTVGRLRPDLAPGLRSSPFRSHVVFYEVSDDAVDVVRVLHGARDIPVILG